jgi:hypothetical protein
MEAVLATEPSGVFEAFFEALAAMSDTPHRFKCSTPRWCAATSRLSAQKGDFTINTFVLEFPTRTGKADFA